MRQAHRASIWGHDLHMLVYSSQDILQKRECQSRLWKFPCYLNCYCIIQFVAAWRSLLSLRQFNCSSHILCFFFILSRISETIEVRLCWLWARLPAYPQQYCIVICQRFLMPAFWLWAEHAKIFLIHCVALSDILLPLVSSSISCGSAFLCYPFRIQTHQTYPRELRVINTTSCTFGGLDAVQGSKGFSASTTWYLACTVSYRSIELIIMESCLKVIVHEKLLPGLLPRIIQLIYGW